MLDDVPMRCLYRPKYKEAYLFDLSFCLSLTYCLNFTIALKSSVFFVKLFLVGKTQTNS